MRRLILAALLLAACHAPPPEMAPSLKEAIVHIPADVAWSRAVAIFANYNVPIRTMDRSSGIIVSDPVALNGDERKAWLNCGNSGLTVRRRANMTFNVLIQPLGDSSSVRINATAVGLSEDAVTTHVGTQECNSNGVFESHIFRRLETGDVKPT